MPASRQWITPKGPATALDAEGIYQDGFQMKIINNYVGKILSKICIQQTVKIISFQFSPQNSDLSKYCHYEKKSHSDLIYDS